MAVSREKSGNMLPGTSATGRTIRSTASAYTSIRMGTSMRAYGRGTNVMVRAHTGEMRAANSAESTRETGSKTRNTEGALSSTRTVTGTMATGLPGCLKAKEE